jgi:predicted ArsR family transcriptional regulator
MDLAGQAAGIGALADPTRRALYEYVVARGDAVGREQAAAAVGLAVSTAGFHLDKLVAEGLLETEFRRLTGRTGPGAGRPSKLYRRGQQQFEVSLPARRYDLVGEILAAAVDRAAEGADLATAIESCAAAEGLQLGEQARAAGSGKDAESLAAVLGTQGYESRIVAPDEPGEEPVDGSGGRRCVELGNCPFDVLATRHTELVCGLNQHFVQGVLEGLASVGAEARLDPAEDRCCVTVLLT